MQTMKKQPIPGTTIFDGEQATRHVPISRTAAGMMLLDPAA